MRRGWSVNYEVIWMECAEDGLEQLSAREALVAWLRALDLAADPEPPESTPMREPWHEYRRIPAKQVRIYYEVDHISKVVRIAAIGRIPGARRGEGRG